MIRGLCTGRTFTSIRGHPLIHGARIRLNRGPVATAARRFSPPNPRGCHHTRQLLPVSKHDTGCAAANRLNSADPKPSVPRGASPAGRLTIHTQNGRINIGSAAWRASGDSPRETSRPARSPARRDENDEDRQWLRPGRTSNRDAAQQRPHCAAENNQRACAGPEERKQQEAVCLTVWRPGDFQPQPKPAGEFPRSTTPGSGAAQRRKELAKSVASVGTTFFSSLEPAMSRCSSASHAAPLSGSVSASWRREE